MTTVSLPSPFGPVIMGSALPALVDGLQILTEGGWTQHEYVDPATGAHCSAGALLQEPAIDEAKLVLSQAIRASGWTTTDPFCADDAPLWNAHAIVLLWNDEDGRTWEQVRAIWESAIHIAETFAPTPTPNVTPTK